MVRNRQDAGLATPVGEGEAPAAEPLAASATKVGPAFGGHAQAPPEQTSDEAAQSRTGCQVRHADPAVAGWQRRTCWPAAPPHWTAPAWLHAFAAGQVQAALPPAWTQAWAGSEQADDEAGYQQALALLPSCAQVTTSPPLQ
jgi:hypothetical protein